MSSVDLLSILLIAVGLSADCFAVALSASIARGSSPFLHVFRVSLFFGGFQALMPVLGWLAGRTIVGYISGYDHWLAFVLLAFVGSRMVWESFHSRDEHAKNTDITKGLTLLVLSVATSIDALAVGLTFAFLKTNIAIASLTIGVVAFIITTVAFLIGGKVSGLVGKRAEIVGGIVLIGIGIRILLEHIL
ncbi:manganese efflux pump MntP family protein [Chloroflexota bacterium]